MPSPDGAGTRRALRSACVAVALAVAFAVAACGGPREAPLPAGSVVLIVGDSITAGFGVDADEAWPARLARRTGWRVVAAGINGERTAGGRARLPALIDEHAPALVLIELGGNDLLRGVPAAEIAGNLDAMIATARGRGARVALIAAPQPSALGVLTGLAPAGVHVEIAKRAKVPLVEKALPSVLSDETLRQDPLHPNAAGHDALAERAWDELVRSGLATR
jgi:acyl-CoA thioesterase I